LSFWNIERYFLEISLEISFGSETFCTKFCEISCEISLANSREQRTKFAEFHLHYFCTILYIKERSYKCMLHMKQHDNFPCSTNHSTVLWHNLLFLLLLLELTILRIIKHKAITYYCGQNKLTRTRLGGVLPTYIFPTFLPLTNIGDFLQSIIITIIIIIIKMYPITGTNDKETHWRFYMYISTLIFLVRNCYICTEDPYCIIIYTSYVLNAY